MVTTGAMQQDYVFISRSFFIPVMYFTIQIKKSHLLKITEIHIFPSFGLPYSKYSWDMLRGFVEQIHA
jgi:hypothetical protein